MVMVLPLLNFAPVKNISVSADKAQAVIDAAAPGTAIYVSGKGTIPLKIKGGTPEMPIFYIGDGAEITLPGNASASCISAWRQSNFVAAGFKTVGGFHGVLCGEGENFAILDHDISGVGEDGIKVTHSKRTLTRGNKIYNCTEEGIDHVEVEDGEITFNEVFDIRSPAGGVFAKSGSKRISFYRNYVYDCVADGICLGGQGGSRTPVTWITQIEDSSAIENKIERVGQTPINLKGAVNCKVISNYSAVNPNYSSNITVGSGYHIDRSKTPEVKTMMYSRDIEIALNLLLGNNKIVVQPTSNTRISIHDNRTDGEWNVPVGPSAIPRWVPKALQSTDPRVIELEAKIMSLNAQINTITAQYDASQATLEANKRQVIALTNELLELGEELRVCRQTRETGAELVAQALAILRP